MKNFSDLKEIAYKKIKVNGNYKFLNSGYSVDNETVPFLKHHAILENLKNRVKFSNGGTFLITGLRGVGKTTIIKRALYELELEGDITCLPVFINLSRKIEYDKLLFEIVRRLYEAAIDIGILYKIEEDIANEIILSYKRTSLSITNKNMVNTETEAEGKWLENYTLKHKITLQSAKDATFLAYSACDVEHDLLRIIRLLNNSKNINTKLVIVFDELDKITTDQEGIVYFEDILSQIKNIICSAEAISIFVGDIDLFEKWNGDITKINSLYNSIFSWHQYIPCIWDSTEPLLDIITDREYVKEKIEDKFKYLCMGEYTNITKFPFKALLIYINFKSKGIPRNIFSELNHFIIWIKDEPYFQFTDRDVKVITAYNQLWCKLESIFQDKDYRTIIEKDLKFVVCFNIIEYFFSHSDEEFTFDKIRDDLLYDNLALKERLNQILKVLLEKFLENHIIREVREGVYIVSDYTIKIDDNLIIKDKKLLYDEISDAEITLANELKFNGWDNFIKKVKSYNSKAILEFWESYDAIDLLKSNSEMEIYFVKEKSSQTPFLAIFYNENYNYKFENKNCLYKLNKYNIANEYILNNIDIVVDSCIKSSLIQVYRGYILEDILQSQIREEYVLIILEQILKFIIGINDRGYFNADISSSNIMIDNLGNIMVRRIQTKF